ncbi:MAG TPA: hypothetical protein VF407_14745 [Polyangiaceae bacterium]
MKPFAPLRIFTFVTLVVGASALSGCVVHDREPVEYAEADPVVDVRLYPHEYYEGRDVYWVHDRWYYRDGGRWAYFRSEPPGLRERRSHWVVREEHHDEHVREERHEEHEEHDDHGHERR